MLDPLSLFSSTSLGAMYIPKLPFARRSVHTDPSCRHYFSNPKHCWGDIVGSSVVIFWLILPFTILFCSWCSRRWRRQRPQQVVAAPAESLRSSSEDSATRELPQMSGLDKLLMPDDDGFKAAALPEPTHAATSPCRCAPPLFRSIPPIERCGATYCYGTRAAWIVLEGEPTMISPPPPTYKQYSANGI